jgi:hypothetical protein
MTTVSTSRERGVLSSAPMVRALVDGSKTQTRRAMRSQPGDDTTVHLEHSPQMVIDRQGNEQLTSGPVLITALSWLGCPARCLRCV